MSELGIDRATAHLCVGSGWGELIDEVYDALPPDTVVTQLKEKWGGLRVYVDAANPAFFDLLDDVEAKSLVTCELCGKPGRLLTTGWYMTRCEECKP